MNDIRINNGQRNATPNCQLTVNNDIDTIIEIDEANATHLPKSFFPIMNIAPIVRK